MGNLFGLKAEGFLRFISLVLSVLCACLIGFDTQTKEVFFITRRATENDLPALAALVGVEAAVAGYNLIQLCKCMILTTKHRPFGCYYNGLGWVCLLLDQTVAYLSFAATSAATQASALAVTGASHLQWSKLCNLYTRFCQQVGGGLICGFLGSFIMAVVSAISAFRLFSCYSSRRFMVLKTGL